MNFCGMTIDRIHQLVEQSQELSNRGMDYEANLLINEAEDHARELRTEFTTVCQ